LGLDPRRNQDHKRVACLAGAHLHPDVLQSGSAKKGLEFRVGESQTLIAEPPPDPALIVLPEIENQQPPAGPEDPSGL
jgi:hypothetical protein